MKYIISVLLLTVSCSSASLYQELPRGESHERLHYKDESVEIHYFLWDAPPDTLRLKPSIHAVYGYNQAVTIIPWDPNKRWYFGPVTTLNIINLAPDTMSITLVDENYEFRKQLFLGYINMGYYRINPSVGDNVVELSVGNVNRYFRKRAGMFFEIIKEKNIHQSAVV